MVKKIGKVCLAILGMAAVSFGAATLFDFEDVAVGAIPAGWKVESMGKPSPLCTFACVVNATVPGAQSANHVMKITGYAGGTVYADCHICWTDAVSFQDGTIEVDVMATGGSSKENYAGIAWRIKDKNNYYAARYSPSEGLSSFKIVAGVRTSIGTNSGTKTFSADKWYKFKVVQEGNTFTIFVDGTQLRTATNTDITAAGGVGLFMRSNTSKTEWDNLSVTTPIAAVRPPAIRSAQGGKTLLNTSAIRVYNLQGRALNDNTSGMTGMKASASYFGVDQNSTRAIPVLKINK